VSTESTPRNPETGDRSPGPRTLLDPDAEDDAIADFEATENRRWHGKTIGEKSNGSKDKPRMTRNTQDCPVVPAGPRRSDDRCVAREPARMPPCTGVMPAGKASSPAVMAGGVDCRVSICWLRRLLTGTGNQSPLHTLEHVHQVIEDDPPRTLSIWIKEKLAILCGLGHGEVPVLHGWNDDGAGVAWAGVAVPGEEV
jgi:hypothetical protein